MSNALRNTQENSEAVQAIAEMLYGDGVWEITKALTEREKKAHRRQAQVGLASNIVGLAAGAAGTSEAYNKYRSVKTGTDAGAGPVSRAAESLRFNKGVLKPVGAAAKYVVANPVKTATAGLGLQVANVAGDAVANRVLARSAKKKSKVKKASDLHERKYKLAKLGVEKGFAGARQVPIGAKAAKDRIKKSDDLDVVWAGEISKMDTDKRQVFGWASIIEVNGEPVVDLQGDLMTIDTIEKAAYDYVRTSRKGGNQHAREGDGPRHVSDMIESFIVTEEKKKQMGLPDSTPTGWWVGFQVNDDDTWAQVKSGERKEFSIHGSGVRKDIS